MYTKVVYWMRGNYDIVIGYAIELFDIKELNSHN